MHATSHELPEIIALYESHQLKDSDIRKALAPFKAPGIILNSDGIEGCSATTGDLCPDTDGIIKGGSLFVQK